MIATEQTVMEGHKATRDLAEKADVVIIGRLRRRDGGGGTFGGGLFRRDGGARRLFHGGGGRSRSVDGQYACPDRWRARLDTSTNGELMLTYGNCVAARACITG